MQSTASPVPTETPKHVAEKPVFSILLAIAFCRFLNDMVQSLIPAIYQFIVGIPPFARDRARQAGRGIHTMVKCSKHGRSAIIAVGYPSGTRRH